MSLRITLCTVENKMDAWVWNSAARSRVEINICVLYVCNWYSMPWESITGRRRVWGMEFWGTLILEVWGMRKNQSKVQRRSRQNQEDTKGERCSRSQGKCTSRMCQVWPRGHIVINLTRSLGIFLQRLFKFWLSAHIRRGLEKGFHSLKWPFILPLEFPHCSQQEFRESMW